jgi:outer membrane protein OmpA-like peptidoglycan-associated protein
MNLFSKTKIMAVGLSAGMLLTGCEAVQNANSTQKGAAAGVAAGAILGGILGNNIGKGGKAPQGAVLGGILGGVAGGLIGNKMDKQAKEIQQALPGAEVERVNEGIKITLKENTVNFNFGAATLTDLAKSNLDKLAGVLVNNPDTNVNIYGYTDAKGSAEYNLTLSEKRANAVRDYLLTKGVASARMFPMGMGEQYATVPETASDADRQTDRKVEFAITANEKMIQEAQQQGGQ